MKNGHRRLTSALVTAILLVGQGASAQTAADHIQSAEKAARAREWSTALGEYRAANSVAKSADASEGVARSLYELKDYAPALAAYETYVADYGASVPKAKKAQAEARIKELTKKTGGLALKANEAGATIFVDEQEAGKTPLVKPLRLNVGARKVRVQKDGFLPIEHTVMASAGQESALEVTLSPDMRKGRVSVREQGEIGARVIVDKVDVGATPWEGELDPGEHEIMLRMGKSTTPPERIKIERGKKSDVVIDSRAHTGKLEVKVLNGKGAIFLDGEPLGEGSFSGDVPAGAHRLEVRRDAFATWAKDIQVEKRQLLVQNVTLEHLPAQTELPVPSARSSQGIYGGLGLGAGFLPGGTGHELELRCNDIGAASCDNPTPMMASVWGYFGYAWNPVGIEAAFGGMADQAKGTADFTGQATFAGQSTVDAGIPRREEFNFIRLGGFTAVRARVSVQGEKIRGSLAAGPGLSYKQMLMERSTTSADGVYADKFIPRGESFPCENNQFCDSYWSLGLSVDASVQFRLSDSVALALGAFMWLENAGSSVRSKQDYNRNLVNPNANPQAVRLATREYQLTSGAQIFVGPYLGVQFGP